MLEVHLFGGFDLQLDGCPVQIPSRSAQTLLAYLLLNSQISHRRERLAALMWPEDTEAVARGHLRQALWYVRKAIDSPGPARARYILADDIWVAFNAQADYRLDVGVLAGISPPEDCTTEDLLGVATAYRGDLLPGFREDWVLLERERLKTEFDHAMEVLLSRLMSDQRWADVLVWGERWIATGHVPEPTYRALMIAHSNLGERAAVAAVFQRCREALANELGVAPSTKTLDLYNTLLEKREAAALPAGPADARHAPAPAVVRGEAPLRQNLPHALTSFVGRERELAEVRRLLRSARLLTLTGSGGAGKTRLAMQAAADMLADFSDGVWLVELASLSDPALVPQTVAAAFKVHATENARLIELLTNHLCGKHLLLLLDNCEHLIGACAEFAEALLSGCLQVRILATSREALNLAGEILFRVPSLALPDPDQMPALETLMQIESIRLFVDRATSARPDFRLTQEIALSVAQICHRLDGMPLAIELAAARVRTLGVAQIATRLDDRFRLLTGGSRTALPRQQTLRATVDWSHDLLSEAERALFRRLSVFAGGWSLEAAEAICADEPSSPSSTSESVGASGLGRADVLDLLSRLVDKSLVMMDDTGGTARYRFLETIRQYALEKLLASGETEGQHVQHLQYFGQLAAAVQPQVYSATPRRWFDLAEAEHDNLRAALRWSLQQGKAEDAVWLAINLWWFWAVRGHLIEGADWLRAVLEVSDQVSRQAQTYALEAASVFAWRNGDVDRADMLAQKCLEQCQRWGDQAGTAFALMILGGVASWREDYKLAEALHRQALAIRREIHEQELAINSLSDLGITAWYLGDNDRAVALCDESIAAGRKLGAIWHLARALLERGIIALSQRDYTLAQSLLAECVTMQEELQDTWTIALCLPPLACLGVVKEHTEPAVRLWGAAEVMREVLSLRVMPPYERAYAPYIARAHDQLGEERFALMWQEGRTLTREQALAEAGRLIMQLPAAAERATDFTRLPAGLTEREATVLRLLAQGLDNQQIADRLVLSKRTVHAHLRSIYAKLDVSTRSAATRKAIDLKII